MCVHVCMYIYINIFISYSSKRERERERERETALPARKKSATSLSFGGAAGTFLQRAMRPFIDGQNAIVSSTWGQLSEI